MKLISRLAFGAVALLCCACAGNSNKWSVNGTISGLNDTDLLILEGHNQGYWYPIDTIDVAADGRFSLAQEAQGYPDIYRLRVGQEAVYFPIDSVETLTIMAEAPSIAANHKLSGTPQAANLARVDSILAEAARTKSASAIVTDPALKRQLGQMLLADPAGIVTYYIVSKSVDGQPLFNPAVKDDRKYIGAVANAFKEKRPADPRTNYLVNLYLSNRTSSQTTTMAANEIGAFEIDLYDNTGKRHSLLDLSKQGKVVLLNFTGYSADWSPAFNVELNNLYQKYKDRGFEIYQVSIDADELLWKEAAKNLPWITVMNDVAHGAKTLQQYNVTVVPTTFVIDRNGEIVERVLEVEDLERAVASHL